MEYTETNFKGIPGPGRPKGALNRKTINRDQRVEWLLERMDEYLEEDIANLKPAERIRLWYDLIEYIRPKRQRISIDTGQTDNHINFTFKVVPAAATPLQLKEKDG
jgi:hypothetical protein